MRLSLSTDAAGLELQPITHLDGPDAGAQAGALLSLAGLLSWEVSSALDALPSGPGPAPVRLEHPLLAARIDRAVATMIDALERSRPEPPAELAFSFDRDELAGGLEGTVTLRAGGAALEIDAGELATGCAHRASLRLRPAAGSILADFHDHRGRGRLSGRLLLGSVTGPGDGAWVDPLAQLLHDFTRWIVGTVAFLPQDRRALAGLYKSLRPEQVALLPAGARLFVSLLRGAEGLGSDDSDSVPRDLRRVLAERVIGGHLGFTHVEGGAPIRWSPADGEQIPIDDAPAHVATTAGLDLYVRHFAAPGDLLFIEEPDLALDPPARREVAGVLSRLAASGVRVVLLGPGRGSPPEAGGGRPEFLGGSGGGAPQT